MVWCADDSVGVPMSDFWVFGYGSLMWRPGFSHLETANADLIGAHRSLCVYSWVHRGTRQRPGLVLGLDKGGSCRGVAFRVSGASRTSVVDYLRERELVTDVYREAWRPIRLRGRGERVDALTYVVDRAHRQYAGRLDTETVVGLVSHAEGRSGANREYIVNTVSHLRTLGVRDIRLERVAEALLHPGP